MMQEHMQTETHQYEKLSRHWCK